MKENNRNEQSLLLKSSPAFSRPRPRPFKARVYCLGAREVSDITTNNVE